MSDSDEEKVLCQTPTPGKQPVRIPSWKYDAIRRAILVCVPNLEPGLEFAELADSVAECLSDELRDKIGSITWHTTTVKLDMEVKGELKRVEGRRPQQLIRTVG